MTDEKTAEGLGVSDGIAFGKVYLFKREAYAVPDTLTTSPHDEIACLNRAMAHVTEEIKAMADSLRASGGSVRADILDAVAALAEDPEVSDSAQNLILKESMNAARAVYVVMNDIVSVFEKTGNDYMKERSSDVIDIRDRVIMHLLGVKHLNIHTLQPHTVIIADNLSTSDIGGLDFTNLAGIVTAKGSRNSHLSIVARNYQIPAVVNAKDILSVASEGDDIIVDGFSGTAYINPTNERSALLSEKERAYIDETAKLRELSTGESSTSDGHRIRICANIGTPDDVKRVIEYAADGVGLLRSEFLYVSRSTLPDEETQFKAYKEVLSSLAPKPVTVRTIDAGGDKIVPALITENDDLKESNPSLGYRGIRISLDRSDIFSVQLRALLRASIYGNLKIMFPLVSSLEELRAAKRAVQSASSELKEHGIPYNTGVPIGIMIETPAAAIMADKFAKECDFFSIGTNDLIQYTTAVDRENERVASLYSAYNPAVLRLISHTVRSAADSEICCSMCGEAAGDPLLIPLLIGMGFKELSMNAGSIPKAREVISHCNLDDTCRLACDILSLSTATDVEEHLKTFAGSYLQL